MLTRTRIALITAGCTLAAGAFAQAYPAKTIQMIVPVQAGSGADAILRIVANKMAENLKQQIVLDNQPGAAGLIAMERAARAPTDGYTIAGVNDGSLVKVFSAPIVIVDWPGWRLTDLVEERLLPRAFMKAARETQDYGTETASWIPTRSATSWRGE